MRFPIPTLDNDLIFRAFNHLPVPRVPVWMMRQAGRSDPEYMAYRERAGLTLHDLFRSPEHAVNISLLPKRIGVDAIILYQDILTPLEPMGADFHFRPGPELDRAIESAEAIDDLRMYDPSEKLGFIAEAIQGVLKELNGELPLLGFAGAPFTLAAFLIAGKSPMGDIAKALAFIEAQPEAFQALLEKLTTITIDYLKFQAESGAQAVQLFESVGDLIPRPIYERYVQPTHEKIFGSLPSDLPTILFAKDSLYPDLMLASGAPVLSIGEQVSVGDMLRRGGGKIAVQGNVDNQLLVKGSKDEIETAVRNCLTDGGGRGHILNLGHGLLKETPFENVKHFVDVAHAVKFEEL